MKAVHVGKVTCRTPGFILGLLAVAAFPAVASAATYTVTGTDDGSGSCTGTTCPTLRAAVSAGFFNPGSTINLGAGTFTLSTGELLISKDTTITGAGPGQTIIRQTDGHDRVFDNCCAALTLSGLTVTGGTLPSGASQPGPAIFSVGPLLLKGVMITGNAETGSDTAGQSVGAITTLNTLTITDSTITDNHATADPGTAGGPGGEAVAAVLVTQDQQITITRSTISNNTAAAGNGGDGGVNAGGAGGNAYGAVFDEDAAPITVTSSTIIGNSAGGGDGGNGSSGGVGGSAFGGGMIVPDATLRIASSTFARNSVTAGAGGTGAPGNGGNGGNATSGGVGGGNRLGDNSILNSTFAGNAARAGAGGPGLASGTAGFAVGGGLAEDTTQSMSVVSSTFAGNVAASPGPVSYGGNLYDRETVITLAQDIFTGGVAATGTDCAITSSIAGKVVENDLGYNLSSSRTGCGLSGAHHDLVGVTPTLLPLADNGGGVPTMALAPGSPGIGAGGTCRDYTTAGAPPLGTDERGAPRAAPCDIGAVQTGAAPPVNSTTTTATTTSSASTGTTATTTTASTGATTTRTTGTTNTTAAGRPRPPKGGASLQITPVSQQCARWRIAKRSRPARRRCGGSVPTGTRFSFTLGRAARVTMIFTRAGSKAGALRLGWLAAGFHSVRFTGHLPHGVTLAPGRYRVTFRASAGGSMARTAPLRFTIVG